MIKLSYNDKAEMVYESLNIQDQRAEDLVYRMDVIIHELTRPRRKGEKGPHSGELLKLFLGLAENEQELAFVAFTAGIKTVEIFDVITPEDEGDWLG
jgi:hypothetical protein